MIRRDSSAADLDALEIVCQRLGGFDNRISLEWVDGCLAALLAGPRVPEMAEWLPHLFGDTWERTFADPPDQAQAQAALAGRWDVLRSQLDPELLFDQPDTLHLAPLMIVPPADGDLPDEIQVGADWARGVQDIVRDPQWGWSVGPAIGPTLMAIAVLALPPGDVPVPASGTTLPTRDDLIDAACWALQDLRMYWIDHAPRTAPRRVEASPGRNDPCPCGSGRKFKKCHGLS
jgi:uncharacterized protein